MSRKKDKNSRSKLVKKKANIAKMKQKQRNVNEQQNQSRSLCKDLPYRISESPVVSYQKIELPKEIEQRKRYIFDHLADKPTEFIDELQQLIIDYPQVREFGNYLGNCYRLSGNQSAYEEHTLQLFQHDPSYLFARFQVGLIYLEQEKFTELLELFGGKFDLKALAPERDVFHVSEVESFFYIAGSYFAWNNNLELLDHSVNILLEIEPESTMAHALMNVLMIKRMEHFAGNMLDN